MLFDICHMTAKVGGGYVLTQINQLAHDMTFLGNQPLWFLFILFVVRIVYNVLKEKIGTLPLAVLCFMISFMLYHSTIDYPYYLASIPAGTMYYILGHKLRETQYKWLLFIISAAIYTLCAVFGWNLIDMHWNVCVSGHYLLWIPTSLAGIILINNIFRCLPNINLLEWIGRHSMVIFVTHTLILEVAIGLFRGFIGIREYGILTIILITSEILVLPLLITILSNKHLVWMTGKRKT